MLQPEQVVARPLDFKSYYRKPYTPSPTEGPKKNQGPSGADVGLIFGWGSIGLYDRGVENHRGEIPSKVWYSIV